MDAAMVSRVMDLIPDRVARTLSGTAFADVRATTCVHPERMALMAEFLHWVSPLYPTTRDDQMRLGLFAGNHRQMLQADPDEEEVDEEAQLQDEEIPTAEGEASLRIADACVSSPL